MRYHRRFASYLHHHEPSPARSMFAVSHLVAARLEPTFGMRPEALLDLIFAREDAFGVLSGIVVDGTMLLDRETSPFVWPEATRDLLMENTLRECEAQVEPWLRSRVVARSENDEVWRYFVTDDLVVAAIERARAEGLHGAVPWRTLLRSVAPALFAYRFARGRKAAVTDSKDANAAALLCGRSERVDFAAGDAERFVRRWFSTLSFGTVDRSVRYGVALERGAPSLAADAHVLVDALKSDEMVPVATAYPIPSALMTSFDPEDSALDATLHVRTGRRVLARSSSIPSGVARGGSEGRIVLIARDDWHRAEDADTDEIRALERRLTAEGFSVRVIGAGEGVDASEVDLAHVIGSGHAATSLPLLQALRSAGIPLVISPQLDDRSGEAEWGAAMTLVACRHGADTLSADALFEHLAHRRLAVDGLPRLPAAGSVPIDPSIAALIGSCDAAIVTGEEESRDLRERYRFRGAIEVALPLLEPRPVAEVDDWVGFDDFVFVHAPLEPRTGVLFVLLAAERAGLPVVFTGPVQNVEYLTYLHAAIGPHTIHIPAAVATPERLEGLYARARVFADVAWSGRGVSRLARAGTYGAALVTSRVGFGRAVGGDSSAQADPAGIASIVEALRDAWETAPVRGTMIARELASRADPKTTGEAVLRAYAQAARPRAAF